MAGLIKDLESFIQRVKDSRVGEREVATELNGDLIDRIDELNPIDKERVKGLFNIGPDGVLIVITEA